MKTTCRISFLDYFNILWYELLALPSAQPRTMGPSDGQQMAVTALVWMNLLQITCAKWHKTSASTIKKTLRHWAFRVKTTCLNNHATLSPFSRRNRLRSCKQRRYCLSALPPTWSSQDWRLDLQRKKGQLSRRINNENSLVWKKLEQKTMYTQKLKTGLEKSMMIILQIVNQNWWNYYYKKQRKLTAENWI